MSFSENIKLELIDENIKKNCCKKAFLLGLLINSTKISEKTYEVSNISKEAIDKTEELLLKLFSTKCERVIVAKPGKKYHTLRFFSRSLSSIFDELNSEPDEIIQDSVGFNCSSCEQAFLRGAFISCAKLSDPQKTYHLEFTFAPSNITIASKFYRFLSMIGFVPKITNRKNSIGLYIKTNTMISDLLYYVGAVKTSFDYSNAVIEKDIRNYENRATNCVTNNIMRTVSAASKQINEIELLMKTHKFDALPDELKETALIRLNNPEASLTDLALMHSPPISKSGLNHRLKKLSLEAELI